MRSNVCLGLWSNIPLVEGSKLIRLAQQTAKGNTREATGDRLSSEGLAKVSTPITVSIMLYHVLLRAVKGVSHFDRCPSLASPPPCKAARMAQKCTLHHDPPHPFSQSVELFCPHVAVLRTPPSKVDTRYEYSSCQAHKVCVPLEEALDWISHMSMYRWKDLSLPALPEFSH